MRGVNWVIGLLVAGSLAASVAAEEPVSAPGQALFSRYCATCHGEGAAGDGPSAALAGVPASDLTRLSAENHGVFPVARTIRRIDGRDSLVGHGSAMPIYGSFFGSAPMVRITTDEGAMDASLPVVEIVYFLERLQR